MTEAIPVVRGTLDLLVLKALSEADMHGFEVTSWIEARAGGALGFDDSAVYQALYRLERRALIASDWGVTENNRKARYYRLLAGGQRHLESETAQLVRYAETLTRILTT